MSAINDTPELDYQHLVIESGQSELLGKFYDWLSEKGYLIAEWGQYDDVDDEILVPIRVRPEQLFADFFGIDLDKIEQERRAILDELRSVHE